MIYYNHLTVSGGYVGITTKPNEETTMDMDSRIEHQLMMQEFHRQERGGDSTVNDDPADIEYGANFIRHLESLRKQAEENFND